MGASRRREKPKVGRRGKWARRFEILAFVACIYIHLIAIYKYKSIKECRNNNQKAQPGTRTKYIVMYRTYIYLFRHLCAVPNSVTCTTIGIVQINGRLV